jgi:CheY-like chemotaxis protein
MEQVLINILLNARDAVLEAKNESPRVEVSVGPADGDLVSLRVRDNGVGMSDAAKHHVFEPFFTTKEVGKGTGLGLATSYAIARDRGGSIEIASELGVGTTVDVRLPRVHGREETPPRSSPPPARKHDGELSVLLVDDEPLIRRVMEQALDQHGFRVTAAGDGDAAMAALAASPFDVILLDRSMPGAPGTSLLPTLRERAPDATILYFTGQEVDPEERMLVDGVIQKPVRIGAIVGAIEQAVRKRT